MPLTPDCFLVLFSDGIFLGDFEKFPLVSPLHFFRKWGVLGDLAKIAITWPFGHFWSRFFAPKSSPVYVL